MLNKTARKVIRDMTTKAESELNKICYEESLQHFKEIFPNELKEDSLNSWNFFDILMNKARQQGKKDGFEAGKEYKKKCYAQGLESCRIMSAKAERERIIEKIKEWFIHRPQRIETYKEEGFLVLYEINAKSFLDFLSQLKGD